MARQLDLTLIEQTCTACAGKREAINPDWTRFVESLTAEEMASGAMATVPKMVACKRCRGLGFVVSEDFVLLRDILARLADAEPPAK